MARAQVRTTTAAEKARRVKVMRAQLAELREDMDDLIATFVRMQDADPNDPRLVAMDTDYQQMRDQRSMLLDQIRKLTH
jgi:hypothetical protein